MKLVDTHCHLHDPEFYTSEQQLEMYSNLVSADTGIICASTSEQASRSAVSFAANHENVWAMVGVHPHDTKDGYDVIGDILAENHDEIVGLGEIGLDYYYMNSPRETQIVAFEQQLQWSIDYGLPISFHVRDAKDSSKSSVWDDFWPIFDNFRGLRGVLHSFTDVQAHLDEGFERGLYVGVNGICTFTKDPLQQTLYQNIPLEKLLLETDAPFLTPAPLRGKINEPSFVGRVAEHMATVHGVSLDFVSTTTTANAKRLFSI